MGTEKRCDGSINEHGAKNEPVTELSHIDCVIESKKPIAFHLETSVTEHSGKEGVFVLRSNEGNNILFNLGGTINALLYKELEYDTLPGLKEDINNYMLVGILAGYSQEHIEGFMKRLNNIEGREWTSKDAQKFRREFKKAIRYYRRTAREYLKRVCDGHKAELAKYSETF